MEAIFLKILNMSITASWLVLAIVILRLILKKAPKAISVFMWALVGVRLICPFSFESILRPNRYARISGTESFRRLETC